MKINQKSNNFLPNSVEITKVKSTLNIETSDKSNSSEIKSDQLQSSAKKGSATEVLTNMIPKSSSNGIWIWDRSSLPKGNDLDNLLKMVKDKGFNKLYIHGHPDITRGSDFKGFKSLVEKAAKYDLKIDILLGNPEWVNDPSQANIFKQEFLTNVIDFWKECPENAKPGLHLDIEPHALPEWRSNKSKVLEKTMSLYDEVNQIFTKAKVDIDITADIPHWWDKEIMSNGKSAFANISEKVDQVVLMSYGDTSKKVINFSEDENNSKYKNKVVTAIETDGKKLVGWNDLDQEIKGENLSQAFTKIHDKRNNVSVHLRPDTNIFDLLKTLPDQSSQPSNSQFQKSKK